MILTRSGLIIKEEIVCFNILKKYLNTEPAYFVTNTRYEQDYFFPQVLSLPLEDEEVKSQPIYIQKILPDNLKELIQFIDIGMSLPKNYIFKMRYWWYHEEKSLYPTYFSDLLKPYKKVIHDTKSIVTLTNI